MDLSGCRDPTLALSSGSLADSASRSSGRFSRITAHAAFQTSVEFSEENPLSIPSTSATVTQTER